MRFTPGMSTLILAVFLSISSLLPGESPAETVDYSNLNAAGMDLALEKLGVLGSALYVAAHPDDENTTLMAYLSQGLHLRVGYLSMTRGDGGQNLIGSEKGDLLGVIRTQELLAARRIDGAEQYFTRAIDFGYSKSPEETLEIWGHEATLADVVWVIRNFRPDVIITRFPTDRRGGHGHHTASAVLALEAFEAAADPSRFPEQLEWVEPWQTKRIFWNAWRPDLENRDPALPVLLPVDLGSYNPLLGESYTELAARSRSMHKTQGFGRAASRGERLDYLEHMAGEEVSVDLMEGIDTGWSRVEGGEPVASLVAAVRRDYRPDDPAAILPDLVRIDGELASMPPDSWVDVKRAEVGRLIRAAAGLWLEAVAPEPIASPGDSLAIALSAVSRTRLPITLKRVELPLGATLSGDPELSEELEFNRPFSTVARFALPEDIPSSNAYWLRESSSKGAFAVDDLALIGRAESPAALTVRYVLGIAGGEITYDVPVVYRWTDRVAGERYRRFEIGPPVTARFDRDVYLFPSSGSREIQLTVRATAGAVSGSARLQAPPGWSVEPGSQAYDLEGGGAEQRLRFTVSDAGRTEAGPLRAVITMPGSDYSLSLSEPDHPHIPVQAVFLPAEARVVRVEVAGAGGRIGYVMGSGDQIPEALTDLGYEVVLLTDDDLATVDLDQFSAVVFGIRAFNTRERLLNLQGRLLEYVHGGGRMVVQYNTLTQSLQEKLGPYPFKLSRDRVTVEEAPVRILAPDHPLMTEPNRISEVDFEGWVQERGLYFSNEWDPRYQTVLSSNDPGEDPADGGLLYTEYGEGVFIYTGYSWFRELPAGVPGAYRLYVNLLGGAEGE
jgi:LmbE family N-acetylglucosaminyl deacetylase